jgi:hypothetical protein
MPTIAERLKKAGNAKTLHGPTWFPPLAPPPPKRLVLGPLAVVGPAPVLRAELAVLPPPLRKLVEPASDERVVALRGVECVAVTLMEAKELLASAELEARTLYVSVVVVSELVTTLASMATE